MIASIINSFENSLISQRTEAQEIFDSIRSGDVIEVSYKSTSTKSKKSAFVGICIAKRRKSLASSLTLRNYVMGEAVEYTLFPYSPQIENIKIRRDTKPKAKFRRAKLYYLRSRTPKESTVS